MKFPPSIAISPSILFWLAFFKMFSSTVRSLISLQGEKPRALMYQRLKSSSSMNAAAQPAFPARNRRHVVTASAEGSAGSSHSSPVDVDVSGLADSVAAVLGLGVHGGVPVAVVEHHRVGPRQVHPYASAASRQDEAEDPPVCVEALHQGLKEGTG